jgi:hypothetical protein
LQIERDLPFTQEEIMADHLKDIRTRLKSGKLTDDDVRYLDALAAKAENEGLGEKVGNRRVVARLPNGMDVIK